MAEKASLGGPRLKLERAWAHLEHLEGLTSEFVQAQRRKVAVEDDTEAGVRLWVIEEPSEPDPRWNPIIGDVLYNFRSALDHLAWQLVIQNRKRPRGTALPLYDDIREFVDKGLPAIRGMSEPVRTAIEAAQPYHRPSSKYRTDALLLLNKLNNVYRHRHFKLTLLSIIAGTGRELPEDFQPYFGPIEGRTIVGVWEVSDPEMEVDYTPFMDVVFAEAPWGNQRVIESLRRIGTAASQLIDTLAREGGLLPD